MDPSDPSGYHGKPVLSGQPDKSKQKPTEWFSSLSDLSLDLSFHSILSHNMSVPTSYLFHKWFTEHSLPPRPCSRSWASVEHEEEQEPDLRELSGEDRCKANRDHGLKGGANEMP